MTFKESILIYFF